MIINTTGRDSYDPNRRPPEWLFEEVEPQPQQSSVHDPNTREGRERFAEENPGVTDVRAGTAPPAPKKKEDAQIVVEGHSGPTNGTVSIESPNQNNAPTQLDDDDDYSPEYTASDLRKTSTYRKNRKEILKRETVCQYCGEKPATQADHIEPVAPAVQQALENKVSLEELDAQINAMDNLAGSCGGKGGCNPSKGAKELSDEPGPGKYVPKNPSPRIQEKIDEKKLNE